MLMFLRDRRSAQTCTRIFNMPGSLAGPGFPNLELFSVILTDNGLARTQIEQWRPDPKHNPNKVLPRGIHVLLVTPHCASQKPHREQRAPRAEDKAVGCTASP